MKGFLRKIASVCIAAAMCLQGGSVMAFTDPADAYAEYAQGGSSNVSETTPSATEITGETESSEIQEDVIEDDLPEETPEQPEPAPAEEDKPAESNDNKKVTKPATEITIFSYQTSVTVGDTFKIGYRLKPSKSDDKVTFSTSSKKIATVDSDGNVTAVGKGSAIITAKTTSGVKDRFYITVKEKKAEDTSDSETTEEVSEETDFSDSEYVKSTNISLKHNSVTIFEGEKYAIIYELTPSNSNDSVSFRSLNKAVASVDKNGVITARGAGNTRIVCTTGSGKKVKLNVTVVPVLTDEEKDEAYEEEVEREYNENGELVPTMVRFGEESVSVQVGSKISLDARVYPSGSKYKYTIKSDDPSIAKVNAKGEVTGIKEGNTVITLITDNGKSDTVYVTVYGDVIPGIDVSKWNGDIDWATVKSTGMAGFAMIRASYGYEDTDPKLADNVRGCEENDIPYGFYHYMYAKNTKEAHMEAAYFLNVISGYSPEYPVVLDIEESFYDGMSKEEVTDIVVAFMEDLENAGYYAMIYSYAKFFDDNLIYDRISDYDIWVACWGDEEKLFENFSYHYGMWQYSETGRMDGIEEYVDLNYCYKDYKGTIKKYGLNRPTVW
ncbi:MAG: Ig-like domain-containing protein [Oscillospiraceae bacterium]|nr:Ig-like domain-containing protein [Oscillospiraceae bacterium]